MAGGCQEICTRRPAQLTSSRLPTASTQSAGVPRPATEFGLRRETKGSCRQDPSAVGSHLGCWARAKPVREIRAVRLFARATARAWPKSFARTRPPGFPLTACRGAGGSCRPLARAGFYFGSDTGAPKEPPPRRFDGHPTAETDRCCEGSETDGRMECFVYVEGPAALTPAKG